MHINSCGIALQVSISEPIQKTAKIHKSYYQTDKYIPSSIYRDIYDSAKMDTEAATV
jgi:hypothetical protein